MKPAKLDLLEEEAKDGTLATAIAEDGSLGIEMMGYIRDLEQEVERLNQELAQNSRRADLNHRTIMAQNALLTEARVYVKHTREYADRLLAKLEALEP